MAGPAAAYDRWVTTTATPTRTTGAPRGQQPATTLRARLLGARPTSARWGWLGPLVITAIGGGLRFWQLGRPHQLVFDETYYVKQGSSLLLYGYERSVAPSISAVKDRADELFTNGTPNVWGPAADFVVHPPVGKWMIAAGQQLFGVNSSFGWRFASAVVGTLSILMLTRIARRLFGSTLLGCVAGLLLAFDGQHFVHSRTGLLDVFVMFWALAAFGALLIDRDQARERLAERVGERMAAARALAGGSTYRLEGFGPGLGLRPWRILAGVCLGLASGTKWSGAFFLATFAVMSVLWDVGARRAAGVRRWWLGGVLRDGLPAFVSLVPVALVAYLASWTGWFRSNGGWDRQWGAQHPSAEYGWVPDSVRGLWKYHVEMYDFNVGLTADHDYKTNPWSWLVQGRPTSFFYEDPKMGEGGCVVAQCSKAITTIGTPTLWWGAVFAIAVLLVMWGLRRDWRAGAVLAGLVGGWLPWFLFQERTIYTFYAVAFVPWVVLSVTYLLALVLGRADAPPRRRLVGVAVAGSYVVTCVVLFFFFWPVYTAQVIPYASWARRMWFPSWI